MVPRRRVAVCGCLVGLAACFLAVPLWPRLMVDQSMVDVRRLADNAPITFRGRVVSVQPDPIEQNTERSEERRVGKECSS